MSNVPATRNREQYIGAVGRRSTIIRPTVTVSTAAYSTGQVLGGLITITNAARLTAGTGSVAGITLRGRTAAIGVAMDVYLLNSTPSGGTYTNNSGLVFSDSDLDLISARIQVQSGDWNIIDGTRVVADLRNINAIFQTTTRDLTAIIVARASITPATTAALGLTVRILQD